MIDPVPNFYANTFYVFGVEKFPKKAWRKKINLAAHFSPDLELQSSWSVIFLTLGCLDALYLTGNKNLALKLVN